MKVLLVNKYFYPRGGSEKVFFDEADLLTRNGHAVGFFSMEHPRNLPCTFAQYFVPGIDYEQEMGLLQKLKEAGRIIYSWKSRKKLRQLLEREQFDLAHLHNIHHQISPAILDELASFGVPAVMTLHDYKLVCPIYNLLRAGRPCELCTGGKFFNCLLHRCTKGSYTKSAINTAEMYLHRQILHLYEKVDRFISPSRFLQQKVKEMGFPGEIIYLPNFVRVEEFEPAFGWEENSIVYYGRLSTEKGLSSLMEAVRGLEVTLKVIGDGPQREELERAVSANGIENVRFLGYKQGRDLYDEIRQAKFVILPSEWYENNPRTVIEAFALGKPVLGSRLGGLPELILDHQTGLTCEPRNPQDLKDKIRYLLDHPGMITAMGQKARRFVEEEFNPERHYQGLIEIYRQAIKSYGRN